VSARGSSLRWTHRQGQYLAFINAYTKLNQVAPAEADIKRYFRVSPPSVHRMILALEERGLLERIPGKGRSIRLLVSDDEIPRLA
jgi:repressor LexA